MNIGILGSGIVGQTLANGFLKYGHQVKIGTSDKSKLNDWLRNAGAGASVVSFNDAAEFGDIIVLAVKGTAALAVLEKAGSNNLAKKTIIDATNPIAEVPPVNGVLQFFTDINSSLMEMLQSKFPSANFVKAFSCVGNSLMVNPDFNGIKPTMFIAGNNINAKAVVKEILDNFGWETEDMGTAEAARAIEPLCILWCIPGFRENKWRHAFKLLK
jgi:8-hydroxy-5-deazaflavin:NADPH oxidoreductase